MLSSVLNSKRAIEVNIEIMRAFVKLRQMLASNAEMSERLDKLEDKYDGQFKFVFAAIRELMAPAVSPKREIGFHTQLPSVRRKKPKRTRKSQIPNRKSK